ncbi:MAG TPA: reverse transcriptase domain-containing protein, partial [Armatimonadota bacterium]|nr:reverse transcriptase domain-containing protein [Armatimonadota bacterium]
MRRDNMPTILVPRIEIVVLNGPETGRRVETPAFPCIVGRGGRSHIVLLDPDTPPMISREHFTLSLQGTTLMLTDHSANGTWVGEICLAHGQSAAWEPGQVVRAGPNLRLGYGRMTEDEGRRTEDGRRRSEREASATGARRTNDGGRRDGGCPPAPSTGRTGIQLFGHLSRPSVQPDRLREIITSSEALHAAWKRVELNRGAPGPDNVSIHEFALDARGRLADLRRRLLRGQYQPLPPRLFAAPKRAGGVRTIAILSIEDRVVQQALHAALQPLIEPALPPCSYAYRPGASAHDALRAVQGLLSQDLVWIAETDIAAFFDTISHRLLLEKLERIAPDPFTLSLVARCLAAGATDPGVGIPQGGGTSPLFSNLYLLEFDAHMLNGGFNPVRYGDDLVFPSSGRGRARGALAEAEGFLRSRLQLALQPEKTRVVHLGEGFTFLGFHFNLSGRRPAPEARQRLQERLAQAAPGEAPAVERGWRNYFGEPTPALPENPRSVGERLLSTFQGRSDVHARVSAHRGKRRFTPCAGPITPELLERHLSGSETLSTYLVSDEGTLTTLALDLDAVPPPGRPLAAPNGSCDPAVADLARDIR